jgi:cell division transport system permease protein
MALHLGYVTRETAVSLRRNLLMTLAGILTVAVSLFLFGGVLLLSRMVDHGTARWKNGVELEIFLCSKSTAEPDSPKPTCRSEASEGQIAAVRAELEQSPDVRRFRFFSKEDAFNEAKRIFAGDPELLSNIDPDGLPVSFRVAPKKAELTEKVAGHFQNRFNDGIDTVLTAKEQVRRLLAGIRWIRGLFFAIAGVLLASSLFLIVNTIRLPGDPGHEAGGGDELVHPGAVHVRGAHPGGHRGRPGLRRGVRPAGDPVRPGRPVEEPLLRFLRDRR